MTKRIKLFEDFKNKIVTNDDYEKSETNHTKYLNRLGTMSADQIRQEFVEGNLSTGLRKKIAARVLGSLVANNEADGETVKLFHELSDRLL